MNKPAKFKTSTSWDEQGWQEQPNGCTLSRVFMDLEHESGAAVTHISFPPECRVEAHTHDGDYFEVILEGSQCVGRTWHHPGDVRVVKAGTGYGPLVSGPEGCRVLVIYPDGWAPPKYLRSGDQTARESNAANTAL